MTQATRYDDMGGLRSKWYVTRPPWLPLLLALLVLASPPWPPCVWLSGMLLSTT